MHSLLPFVCFLRGLYFKIGLQKVVIMLLTVITVHLDSYIFRCGCFIVSIVVSNPESHF